MLDGSFSPVDNRTIPPLKYNFVYRLAREMPHLKITLNGGVESVTDVLKVLDDARAEGASLAGVMCGRGVVSQPWYWCALDSILWGENGARNGVNTRRDLLREYGVWCDAEEMLEGSKKARRRLLRPIVNIFNGEKGSKAWRVKVDDIMKTAGSKRKGYADQSKDGRKLSEVIMDALDVLDPEIVDRTREETTELILLKEELIKEGDISRSNGGVDGVAKEAIRVGCCALVSMYLLSLISHFSSLLFILLPFHSQPGISFNNALIPSLTRFGTRSGERGKGGSRTTKKMSRRKH